MQNIEQSIVLDDGPGNNVNDYRSSDFKIVVDDFVDNFEKSKKKKIIKKSESNLELFMSATI
jgi:hypothetical protein